MVKKKWAKAKYQLNQLTLRERIVLTAMVIVVLGSLWLMLFYEYHKRWLKQTQSQIHAETRLAQAFNMQVSRIKRMSKDYKTLKQVRQIIELKRKMALMDKEMGSYRKKVISPKSVSKVIYAVLKDIDSVNLKAFITTNDALEDISQDRKQLEVATLSVIPKFYHMVLRGQYADIYDYLKRIETLGWQFYWDTFDYQVDAYPMAKVSITLHTLSGAHA